MFRPALELINGTAYRPDAVNSGVPLAQRLAGQSLLLIGFRPGQIRASVVRFKRDGTAVIGTEQTASWSTNDTPDHSERFIKRIAMTTKVNAVLYLAPCRWLSSVVELAFQGSDSERNRLLLEDPLKVVGDRLSEGNVAAVVTHPRVGRSVKLVYTRAELVMHRALHQSAGTTVARLSSGIYEMLRYLSEVQPELIRDRELLLVDGSGALLLYSNETSWDDSGFAADFSSLADANQKVAELVSRRLDPSKPLAFVSSIDLDRKATGLDGPHVEHLLSEQTAPDFYCACIEGKDRLAIDLNPEPVEPRAHLPKSRRALVLAALALSTGFSVGTLVIDLSTRRRVTEANQLTAQTNALATARQRLTTSINKIESDRARAETLGRWISLGMSVQPVVVTAVEAAGSGVTLEDISLRTGDGAPQVEIRITARGDIRTIGAYIDRVSAEFSRAGFNLANLDQTPGNGANAVIYVGRYNYPSPHRIAWKKD